MSFDQKTLYELLPAIYRIRDAELLKIPYVVVWGERESSESLAVRRHGGEQLTMSRDALLDELRSAAKV